MHCMCVSALVFYLRLGRVEINYRISERQKGGRCRRGKGVKLKDKRVDGGREIEGWLDKKMVFIAKVIVIIT